MKIQKIVLRNYRNHEFFEFCPEEEGITNIRGENGAGKSSIVEGFFWCLFGSKANALSGKEYIRDGIDPKTDVSGVEATFALGEESYRVDRHFLSLSGNAAVYVYRLKKGENGEEIKEECAGPGVKETDLFISRLLGVDAKGFSFATFVQQKQIDEVLLASKTSRSEIIERLLSLDVITAAEKASRQKVRDLKASVSLLKQGDTVDIEEEEKKKTELLKSIEDLKKELQKEEEDLSLLLPLWEKKEDELQKKRAEQDELNALIAEESFLKESLKNVKKTLNDQATWLQKLNKIKGTNKNLETIEEALKKKNAEQKKVQETYNALAVNLKEAETHLKKEPPSYKDEDLLPRFSLKDLERYKEKEKEGEDALEKMKASLSVMIEEAKKIKGVLSLFKTGVSVCPTCEQPLEEQHKKKFEDKWQELYDKSQSTLEKKKKYEIGLHQLKNTISFLEAKSQLDEEKALYEEKKKEWSKSQIEVKNQLDVLEVEIGILRDEESEVKSVLAQKETRDRLLENIQKSEEQKKTWEIQYSDLLSKLQGKPDKKTLSLEVKEKEEEKETLGNKITSLKVSLATKKTNLENAEEKSVEQEKVLLKYKQLKKEEEALLERLEIEETAYLSLTRFHAHRIDHSVPELSAIASDLLEKFSEGAFTGLVFDQSFNTTVRTKDDIVRDTAALSGGELSLVALAIRLSVSLFLNAENIPLLILDEVFVSQSKDRTGLVIEALREVCPHTQIILIAHSNFLDECAEKTVFL